MVIGDTNSGAYADEWNGSMWTALSFDAPHAALYAVTCLSATNCQAVGQDGSMVALDEQWNGSAWTIVPTQSATGERSFLSAVSCIGPMQCWADGQQNDEPLVEQFNGATWSIVSMPAPSGNSVMSGISCAAASFCAAVGTTYLPGTQGGTTPLIETWDGLSWSVSSIPVTPVAGQSSYLFAVDCFDATRCIAVGAGPSPALVLQFEGGAWELGPNPPLPPGTTSAALPTISCVAGWACVAEGSTLLNGGEETFFVKLPFVTPAPPSAVITSPTPGATYSMNQVVPTAFSCSDGSGGPGLVSCVDSNSSASPGALDTSSVGTHTYSVTATSSDGLTSISTINYSVMSPPFAPEHGYWLVGSDGGVFSFGASRFYGSTGSINLQAPIVGIVPTADRGGYWLDASDGGVFSFGDTQFFGSIPGLGIHPAHSGFPNSLNAPIVGMVTSSDGRGYFMVGADGGVFAFGDAKFEGSCPGIGGCSGTAVAVMPDRSGNGYWVITTTGQVYTFGDARYFGAPNFGTVTSAVAAPNGDGYWILLGDGQVFGYGKAATLGSPPADRFEALNPATAIFATSDGDGYWVAAAEGGVFNFGDAPDIAGDLADVHLNGHIIAGSGS